jgi:hypothetical protein
MCGKKIGDTDHFCQFCGASTGFAESSAKTSEIKEEIIFNPPYEDKSPKTEEEELKEFISEEEIEEAQQEGVQTSEEEETPETAKNQEFAWNVYEFPTEKKKTEDVEFNWNMEDYGQPEPMAPKEAALEEDLFQEIRDESNRIKEQNIDRFFTFSRKNEEFQELLDKEYEKFQMRGTPIKETVEEPPKKEAAEEPPLQEIHFEAENVEEPEIPEAAQYEEPALDTETPAEEDAQEPDTIEPEAQPELEAEEPETQPELEAEEPEAQPVPEAEEPEAQPVPEAEEPAEEPISEQLSEMAKARAQYFGDDLIHDNESIRKKLTFGEPKKEDYIKMPAVIAEAEAEAEAEEDMKRTVPAAAVIVTSGDEEDKEEPAQSEELAQTEEPEQRKRSAGQIVLAAIAIILVIEIAILGIRYFAPESGAATAIGNVQTGIFNTVTGWFDGDSGKKSESADDQEALPEDSEKTDQESVEQEEPTTDDIQNAPAADPNPMADKNALVASQMGNNKNIEQVKANDALAWQQYQNYGLSDINNSKPITNNIWQAPEAGDPVYYDRSVVGTVIAFDSQWIDYVNSGDKSVLSLMKKDSEAYRKSANYTKVGKIKETFKLLEIGEIRQGANGFYIWVHEEIGATENGKTSDMKYNWIYYLEPESGQMKIVNYYHF